MQSLLRWSIENSSTQVGAPSNGSSPSERQKLDPGIIDAILGKPDSKQMEEDLAIAVDTTRSEDERVEALDHLEMLVEHIDNANDLQNLKLWEPLHSLLGDETSTESIKVRTLWVIGTAVQNNPAAQDVYLAYDPLPDVVSFLGLNSTATPKTTAKAIYALSGLLQHNGPAVAAFGRPDVNGWPRLRENLRDGNPYIRQKAISLLRALLVEGPVETSNNSTLSPESNGSKSNILMPDNLAAPKTGTPTEPSHPNSHAANLRNPSRTATYQLTLDAIRDHELLDPAIESLIKYSDEDNLDYEENAMKLLYAYIVTFSLKLSSKQKEALGTWITSKISRRDDTEPLVRWGYTSQEYDLFSQKLLV